MSKFLFVRLLEEIGTEDISLAGGKGTNLGEAIVSGELDPDQWVIDKKTGETISEYIATKEVMTIRRDRDVELVEVDPDRREEITFYSPDP